MTRPAESIKVVLAAIEAHPGLDHDGLQAATGIPGRTIRFAVSKLIEDERVFARRSLMDARKRHFFLTGHQVTYRAAVPTSMG